MHDIPFTTVIVTNKKPSVTEYINASLSFKPKVINLRERDADSTLAKIKESLIKNEPVNELELIYFPLYGSDTGKTMYDLLDTAIKLVPQVAADSERRNKLHSLLILLTGKFADEEEFEKVLEANRMILEDNVAVKVIEKMGFKKGREKGREEVAREMITKDYDVAEISAITGLHLESIEKMKAEILETV